MIISKIIGGIGNQLFQYAVGRALAHLNNTSLKLDVSSFDKDALRNFSLQYFNAKIDYASEKEIMHLIPSNSLDKVFQHFLPVKSRKIYKEKYFHFDENVLRLGPNVYLRGYFQSEKYFMVIKDIIRNEFRLRDEKTKPCEEIAMQMAETNSISVHIRRGDFAKDEKTMAYHGILGIDYYSSAFEIIQSKIPDPIFYFFSDDIDWVKQNFPFPGSIYVSGNLTNDPLQDLYLMTQCKHNIIANSSFSWWGAWLNNKNDKIVIAPDKWFGNGPQDTQDIIPGSWIRI